jgi:hypothetical protein
VSEVHRWVQIDPLFYRCEKCTCIAAPTPDEKGALPSHGCGVQLQTPPMRLPLEREARANLAGFQTMATAHMKRIGDELARGREALERVIDMMGSASDTRGKGRDEL